MSVLPLQACRQGLVPQMRGWTRQPMTGLRVTDVRPDFRRLGAGALAHRQCICSLAARQVQTIVSHSSRDPYISSTHGTSCSCSHGHLLPRWCRGPCKNLLANGASLIFPYPPRLAAMYPFLFGM